MSRIFSALEQAPGWRGHVPRSAGGVLGSHVINSIVDIQIA
jgi:hypothetical protein